ncbi:MAG: Ig-like domain-containing protein [Archangium sp.]|nr:Ig-like domain-containing protein [Archangium sp.]
MSDARATRLPQFEGPGRFTSRAPFRAVVLLAALIASCGPADTTPPAVPTGLNAVAGNQLVTLSWIANSESDLLGYDIHQGTISGELLKVATIAAPASRFVVGGLNNATPYFFAITAADKAGNVSALSAEVRATPFAPDTIPPTLVSSVPAPGATAVAVNTSIVLTFSEDMDTSSVTLTIAPAVALNAAAWTNASTVTFQPSAPLASGTAWTVTVDGRDVAGNTLAGLKNFSFTTATETMPPAMPRGLSATAGNQLVTLTWEANSETDLAGYDVFQGTATGVLNKVATVAAPAITHVVTGLANGTTYFFALAARDQNGNASERTAEVSATPFLPDTMRPTVSLSTPTATTGVAVDTALTFGFSEDMDPGTVMVALVPLPPSGELGPATWLDGKTVRFQPTAVLAFNTTYTVTVLGSDLAGNALTGTNSFSFLTVNPPDLTAPQVLATGPADGASLVGVSNNITFEFSEAMNPASVQGAFSATPAISCSWAVSGDGRSFTCVHAIAFTFGANYVVTMGTGATDLAGNPLAASTVIHFSTAAAPDTVRPVVCPPTGGSEPCPATSATFPAPGAIGIARTANIIVRFSEPMNQASVQAAFAITAPAGHTTGVFTWNAAGDQVTFNPDVNFGYGDNVSWRIGTGATDLASTPNALLATFTSTFRVIRQTSVTIYSSPTLDGFLSSNGGAYLDYNYGAAGDSSTNTFWRTFLSFDLSSVPADASVLAATLYGYQTAINGTPYSTLGELKAASVNYGSSLTAADFETPIIKTLQCPVCVPPYCLICNPLLHTKDEIVTLSTTTTMGTKSVDVARKVSDDLANRATRGSRSQFRVYFPTTTDTDSTLDDVILFTGEATNTTNRARLSLSYEYP